MIDSTIEECSQERDADEREPLLTGARRVALDIAFGHNRVEEIFESLKQLSQEHRNSDIQQWAKTTLDALEQRSPTSLKVALQAIRRGRGLTLLQALQTELNIATAFCVRLT